MRLTLIIFTYFLLTVKSYSQGARNCANISDEYNFLYGITNNLSTISLKNSLTGNFVPEGKEYQIAFVGEFYDPTVVFNFSADLGIKFSKLDLTKLDSVNYKQWFVKNLSSDYLAQRIDFQFFKKWSAVVKIGLRLFLHVREFPEHHKKSSSAPKTIQSGQNRRLIFYEPLLQNHYFVFRSVCNIQPLYVQ